MSQRDPPEIYIGAIVLKRREAIRAVRWTLRLFILTRAVAPLICSASAASAACTLHELRTYALHVIN
jgi:hypothetical protein